MKSEGAAPATAAELMESGAPSRAAVVAAASAKPASVAAKRRRCCCVAVAVVSTALMVVLTVLLATSLHTLRQLRDDLPQNLFQADATADLRGAKMAVGVQPQQQVVGYHGVSVSAATCTVFRAASGGDAAVAAATPLATLQLTGAADVVVTSSPSSGSSSSGLISFTVSNVNSQGVVWALADALTPLLTDSAAGTAGSSNTGVALVVDCDLDVEVVMLGVLPVRFSTTVQHKFGANDNGVPADDTVVAATFTGTVAVALPALEYAFGDAGAPSATVATHATTVVCSQARGCTWAAPTGSSSSSSSSSSSLVVYQVSPNALAGPLTCRSAPTYRCGLFATATSPSSALSSLLGDEHEVVLLGSHSFSTSPRPARFSSSSSSSSSSSFSHGSESGGERRLATTTTDADCVQTMCYSVDVDASFTGEWCGSFESRTGDAADGSFSVHGVSRVLQVYPTWTANGTIYTRELATQTTTLLYDPNDGAPAVNVDADASFNGAPVMHSTFRTTVAASSADALQELAVANDFSLNLFATGHDANIVGSAPVQITTAATGETSAELGLFIEQSKLTCGSCADDHWSLDSTFSTVVTPQPASAEPSYFVRYDGAASFARSIPYNAWYGHYAHTSFTNFSGSLVGNSSLVIGAAAEGGTTTAHFLDLGWETSGGTNYESLPDASASDFYRFYYYHYSYGYYYTARRLQSLPANTSYLHGSSFSLAVGKANVGFGGKVVEVAGSVSVDGQALSSFSAAVDTQSVADADGNQAFTVATTAAVSCSATYAPWSVTVDAPVTVTTGTDPAMLGLMDMRKLTADVSVVLAQPDLDDQTLLSLSLSDQVDSSETAVTNAGSFTLKQPGQDRDLVTLQTTSSVDLGSGSAGTGGFTSVHSAKLGVTEDSDATVAYDFEVGKFDVAMDAFAVDLSSSLTFTDVSGAKTLLYSLTATDELTAAEADTSPDVNTFSLVVASGSVTNPQEVLSLQTSSSVTAASADSGAGGFTSTHSAQLDVADSWDDGTTTYDFQVAKFDVLATKTLDLASSLTSTDSSGVKTLLYSVAATDEVMPAQDGASPDVNILTLVVGSSRPAADPQEVLSLQATSSVHVGAADGTGGFTSTHSALLNVTDYWNSARWTAYDLEVGKFDVLATTPLNLASSLTYTDFSGAEGLLCSVTVTDEVSPAADSASPNVNALSVVVATGPSSADPQEVFNANLVSDFLVTSQATDQDPAATATSSSHTATVDVAHTRLYMALDYDGSASGGVASNAVAGRVQFYDMYTDAPVALFATNVSLRAVVDSSLNGPAWLTSSHNVSVYTQQGNSPTGDLWRTDYNLSRVDAFSGADLLAVRFTVARPLGAPVFNMTASLHFADAAIDTLDLLRGSPALGQQLATAGFTVAATFDLHSDYESATYAVPVTWAPAATASALPAGHNLAQVSVGFDMAQSYPGNPSMSDTALHYLLTNSLESAADGSSFFSVAGNGMCDFVNTLTLDSSDNSLQLSAASYVLLGSGADAGGLVSWHSASVSVDVYGTEVWEVQVPKLNAFVGTQLLRVAHTVTFAQGDSAATPVYDSDLSIVLQPLSNTVASTASLLTTPWAETVFATDGFAATNAFTVTRLADTSPVCSITAPLSVSFDTDGSGPTIMFDAEVASNWWDYGSGSTGKLVPYKVADALLQASPAGVAVDVEVFACTGEVVVDVGFNTTASLACSAPPAGSSGGDPCLSATCLGSSTCNEIDTPYDVLEDFFDCDCSGCDATTTTTTTPKTTTTTKAKPPPKTTTAAATTTAASSTCETRACGATTCSVLADKTATSYASIDKTFGCSCTGCDAVVAKPVNCEWWSCEE